MKKISDSYLYNVADCGKDIFNYLMSSHRVDKSADSFNDIIYAVKKQTNTILMRVMLSDKVVLLINPKGISRAFKVIYAKDSKDKKDRKKVFIDCTGIISYENGVYICKRVGALVSYLNAAMTYILYYNNPKSIITNNVLIKTGTEAFVDLVLYVLGYLKIPITYADNKERMSFVLAEYFQTCVMGIDHSFSTVYNTAKQVSGIESKNTCDYLHTLFSFIFADGMCKLDKFLAKFAEVFLGQTEGEQAKSKNPLTIEAFSQRWMYVYGPGTFLGLECFVPFSQILTDCANGAYLNQQNTIEKVAGSKTVVTFYNELLKVGSENA